MNRKTRSPIKDKPLRSPGQSLEEQRSDLFYDKLVLPFFAAVFFCALAVQEWWRFFVPAPPSPGWATAMALAGVSYSLYQYRRIKPRLHALRQGRDGEKAVGQYLEGLRERGYSVFHDVLGDGFNVDHVLIGPAGVFTVETKTISKPVRGDARISFDGESITVNGFEPDRDPVTQARAQSAWLQTILAESTGKRLGVRPVILFPGWYVEQSSGSTRKMWALEPKAFSAFLENAPQVLSSDDVRLASFHLSRFIRSEEQKRAESR